MAEAKKAPVKKEKASARYFRNKEFAAGSILIKNHDFDPTLIETVRFVPYYEEWRGDRIKVGYLKVEDPKIAERVANARHVEEIKADEFKEATEGKDSQRAPL